MKRHLWLVTIVLLFLPSLACGSFTANSVTGSGDLVTQTVEVGHFDRVALEGFGTVFIEQGQTDSLSVQTDDNLLSLLDINVRGNELRLGIKPGYDLSPSQSITFNVTVKDLNRLEINGSGSFEVEPLNAESFAVAIEGSGDIHIQGLTADDLAIELDGSGNITIDDIQVKSIDTSVQGSGDINLEGEADSQKVAVSGSGNYLAGELETARADINIPGSADVTVWATDELDVRVNGSGDVRYYGQPTIDQSGSGSGALVALGEK